MVKASTPKVIIIATIQMLIGLEIPLFTLSSLPCPGLGVCFQLLVLISHWRLLWTQSPVLYTEELHTRRLNTSCLILIQDRAQPCPSHPRGCILKKQKIIIISHTLPTQGLPTKLLNSAALRSQPFKMTRILHTPQFRHLVCLAGCSAVLRGLVQTALAHVFPP